MPGCLINRVILSARHSDSYYGSRINTLIDSHCHLDFPVFDHDRSQLLSRAAAAGISDIIIPAVSQKKWPSLTTLNNHAGITLHKAFGLHPCFLTQHKTSHIDDLRAFIRSNDTVAIGECGLDYYTSTCPDEKNTQQLLFEQQLQIAVEADLPVIIHARKAVEDVLNICKHYSVRAVLHSFSGSQQQAKRAIDAGYYLGFGGPVTWDGSTRLHKLVSYVPLSSIVLESDAPDQPDQKHKGQRNEPSWLAEIARVIARLHSTSQAEVSQRTTQNAKTLFSL